MLTCVSSVFLFNQPPPSLFRGNLLATSPRESKLKNWRTRIQNFPVFLSDHLPLELMPVRLGPGQFEFKMRFRPVWLF
jgi:hypothetical protein